MVVWLVQRCGVSAATAREWVTAAARLPSLPKIADALSQGKLSFDQVKPLVEVAKPETDARLAEEATHWSAKQVRDSLWLLGTNPTNGPRVPSPGVSFASTIGAGP